ncbi:bifunctional diaminohydroxyphosphoribosylaminopyrimidine deaminase/5-amino-6-(5-phosphoribosylamino)uracil reductase [Leptospira gomenensis]|uniref:Bifunctional diaminohydroxyphosphoribosylaminopyrimidine deaminase/5-amino-6-(5-phosphoribosylamino)uracil reductase n=1 Tax=Leptospira gomenensis TaxID=2484974 RepID=A0A5F1Y7V6_9LEPT|nr:bifunctional diaminohydroxyphosphoribosylaminopyrimidine deaminase/5-amino-6-(5-phosphoribosylamino)uracil reductase [Leptospira gomenensis]TGK31046.1 bifunctional diaminohydroxyphosphoribosylaminopyrimidine deaminase/5-amino-6-(5-phosphoribosylamino)uracil reductase [Leptospira gomenensis]TGK43251.1 bifunctional diaminohydroxyphosphoribosylaminopyrimidine deaminase/5-amino-6-(5-phosphoribosylamino)uracil reductase [Leptospira gomenensis]TGK45234.1 bifunctional diaminohydroxyphosphoribosylami
MSILPEVFREELRKLAFLSTGESSPNPPVACILTDPDNARILAKGRTSPTGGAHAEKNAYSVFSEISERGIAVPHNVWVTLEPCSHQGKTPPCIDLILRYKPKTLYFGWKDPNPLVRENDGLELCRRAGIEVVSDPDLQTIASQTLFGFASRLEKKKPSMILKTAVSREGHFAPLDKSRFPLSGKVSNHLTSILRAKCDAVLVGPGTLFRDKPGLEFRTESLLSDLSSDIIGEQTIVEESSATQGGVSGFLEDLFRFGADPEIISVHRSTPERYQPYRVFIIFEESNITEEWIEKQESIERKFGLKRCVFFLKKDVVIAKRILRKLSTLSRFEPFRFEGSDLAEECLSVLTSIGVNRLLVEGGNLIYETFSARADGNDIILKIQTPVSLPNGILPALKTDSKFSFWKRNAGEDVWEAYRCSQV